MNWRLGFAVQELTKEDLLRAGWMRGCGLRSAALRGIMAYAKSAIVSAVIVYAVLWLGAVGQTFYHLYQAGGGANAVGAYSGYAKAIPRSPFYWWATVALFAVINAVRIILTSGRR
jgi:hypothetical protein